MSAPVRQFSFSGGEIAPYLYARTDLNKYENGLRTCRNMIPMRHGGVTGRPGTQYVGTTLNGGNPVRLIPFIFNETGLGQSYVLEFGYHYIAFIQNGGYVVSGGNPYKVTTTYEQADLATLQFAQCGDILTIVHPSYAPKELARTSAIVWSLNNVSFGPTDQANCVTNPAASGGASGTAGFAWKIIAFLGNGDESDQAHTYTCSQTNIQIPSPTTPVNLSWTNFYSPEIPAYYKIFRATFSTSGFGTFGYIGNALASATTFVDTVATPDFTNTPTTPSPFESLMGADYYPSTVGFAQQRRIFSGWNKNPLGSAMSKPGSFYNFDVHTSTQPDDDPIMFSLAGDKVNAIQHIEELKYLLILTSGAEIYIQGNGLGVITPSAINASIQSQYGCSPLKPLKLGDVLLFNQALGSAVRDFAFDFSIDGYRGNDITIFASHLFENYQLVDWAFQKIPDSLVWAVRSDGKLLSCTYVREQQVLAWARHDFTNGIVENVCSIPENGNYAVYLVIKRAINGSTVRYIERMSPRLWTDPIDAAYLDCHASYDGRNTGSTTMTLTASGSFQTGTSAYAQSLTLTASIGFFSSAMVGNQIFLEDAEWQSTGGQSGNQCRLIIQAYSDTQHVTVTSDTGAVPSEFQNTATLLWSRAVKTLTGLDYLEGQKVSIWADRYVVGSPLNNRVSTVYTVTAGSITLDKCYAVIIVGLPMIQDAETLDLETYFGETILSKRKRVGKVAAYVYNTRSFSAGTENPDNNQANANDDPLFQLYEQRRGAYQTGYDQPPPLMTDQDYIITAGRWNKNGRLFLRNVDPVPVTILAISPQEEDTTQSYFKRI
jgi:hypothetical protein